MNDAGINYDIKITYKNTFLDNTVSPEEIRLIQAHMNDLLIKILIMTEED